MSKTSGLSYTVLADAALALVSAGYDPADVTASIYGGLEPSPFLSPSLRPAAMPTICSYCSSALDLSRERCRTCGAPSSP